MTTVDRQESTTMDEAIKRVLNASTLDGAFQALRDLFASQMDFHDVYGSVALHSNGLPPTAARIAERQGVRVVGVALPDTGRMLMDKTRSALKEIRESLGGDVLLVLTDGSRSQWHFVYPSTDPESRVLRRMVIHKGQPYRTVAERLGGIYNEARRTDLRRALEAAYDVEAVTKSFFREYRRVFDQVKGLVQGDLTDEERKLFCQTLMNRLMFLYFLQKKGWLRFNGDTNYLHALWRDSREKGDSNFYSTRLDKLFFTALSNEWSRHGDAAGDRSEAEVGKVPFLNGGLFERTDLDKKDVFVPDTAIDLILNDLFARFNFTIAESTPYDVEVAVDPEMLGKVFEELVTGRHKTGSYYTPRLIVAFMCREALKHYLVTKVPGLSADAASAFIDENDVSKLNVQQASRVLDALESVTVLDPACGSGAYLLGMLHELIEQQRLLYNSNLIANAKSLYELKLRVIERNVYGVDIDPFAVNIAMLRLWLSLIVDFDGSVEEVPPLPNLAFKIVCGDSLLAPNPEEATDLFRHVAHEQARDLARLKAEFMRDTGKSKRETERQIRAAQAALAAMLSHSPAPTGSVDWRVQFAEVFDQNGGFDIVLANPPYVRQELIRDIKPGLRQTYGALYSGTADLYVYFYYRALQTLTDGGMLVFISSNKWFRANYGAKLRAHFAKNTGVLSITDFGELPVFETAATFPMIIVTRKAGTNGTTMFTQVKSLAPPYPDVRALIDLYGQALPSDALNGENWGLSDSASALRLRTMTAAGKTLGEYVHGQIYYGIKTGLNAAFVINGAKRAELIAADPKSAEIIKPFAVGDNVRRWRIDQRDKWLILTRIGVDISRYPAVLEHLSRWQSQLEARWDKGDHWWELRSCAYYDAFDRPKIACPDIAREPRFTLDRAGTYFGNTGYIVPVHDLYLLGVLNSNAVWQYAQATFSCLGDPFHGGRFRFIHQSIATIPIPNASPVDRNAIADHVQKCLDAKGQGPQVSVWESEINERVARLYGLTAGEVVSAVAYPESAMEQTL
ncbi:MAG: Eco57I restriction-modification methylase domain-containing protein [Chloroflexota bacterium]|nr:Eco57I restriction-modification methylase domain-containing protein [Chloroflexota bacterium]